MLDAAADDVSRLKVVRAHVRFVKRADSRLDRVQPVVHVRSGPAARCIDQPRVHCEPHATARRGEPADVEAPRPGDLLRSAGVREGAGDAVGQVGGLDVALGADHEMPKLNVEADLPAAEETVGAERAIQRASGEGGRIAEV